MSQRKEDPVGQEGGVWLNTQGLDTLRSLEGPGTSAGGTGKHVCPGNIIPEPSSAHQSTVHS